MYIKDSSNWTIQFTVFPETRHVKDFLDTCVHSGNHDNLFKYCTCLVVNPFLFLLYIFTEMMCVLLSSLCCHSYDNMQCLNSFIVNNVCVLLQSIQNKCI